MSRLLWISSSPREQDSKSNEVARCFLDTYAAVNPSASVTRLDLWTHSYPELDQAALGAKYAVLRRANHTAAEAEAWAGITAEAEAFKAYDKYVFSIPMWNWGLPYVLKKYIDTITQPGLLFNWSPATGYVGLLGRPAVAIYASSFDYGDESDIRHLDHQKNYFETWLSIIGCTPIQSIVTAPTSAAFPQAADAHRTALERSRALAQTF